MTLFCHRRCHLTTTDTTCNGNELRLDQPQKGRSSDKCETVNAYGICCYDEIKSNQVIEIIVALHRHVLWQSRLAISIKDVIVDRESVIVKRGAELKEIGTGQKWDDPINMEQLMEPHNSEPISK
ncbi:hypothetical protein T05_1225 [Trichinella murrelli]|uniref:Uncharacterized protein n=1 Tax=Trichinella murrelli TaxID=144512 RepID=A0A0V0T997_9BILA|nr:hypothetical protein T05_1225 [Trichinella murrelli]